MIGIILGIFTIALGAKGCTAAGLPLTKKKNITGTPALIIGIVCVILGILFILDGVVAMSGMFAKS